MKKFIFDVDGTLTDSRCMINDEFAKWLSPFLLENECYIVTGSDRDKTLEQLPIHLYYKFKLAFQCSGNDIWKGDENIWTEDTELPSAMKSMLNELLGNSLFKVRSGNHIEVRPGLINFSIPGRNITQEQRNMYIKWDKETQERDLLAQMIGESFPNWDCKVAGETGIDIVPKGKGKKQIINHFTMKDEIVFFGDKMEPTGNDFELAQALIARGDMAIRVNNWKETWEFLKVM